MNYQHHLKLDPKFGRFSRFSRGGGARGGARGMPRVIRMAIIVVGHGYKAFATVARPSGAFGGSCGQNFRVTIPGVSGVSNPGC